MTKTGNSLLAAALVLAAKIGPAYAQQPDHLNSGTEVGFIQVDRDITLRRMIVHNADRKGTVLLLHGFPETMYAWTEISRTLGEEYEVHAFDWPGFGQSSRPTADKFGYAPLDYARVLKQYIATARIDQSQLTIYATDIGALPALLAALDEPEIARTIIVGDFAPFDRPNYMQERLQRLKEKSSSTDVRNQLNANRVEILENAFTRGLPETARFEISQEFKTDMFLGWDYGPLTSADAFYHYYSSFTRDQNYFESNLARLKTPVKVVWGEQDLYIQHRMGIELAEKIGADLTLLPGVGHYPHLQSHGKTVAEIRASFR